MNGSFLICYNANMARNKKFIIFSLAFAVLCGLVAAFWLRAPRPGSGPIVPPDRIRVANIGIYSIFNLIAEEKGYFKENGLDAQVDEYDSGATSMAALLSGAADVAIAADFVGVTNIFANDDVRILAKVSDQDVWQVVARKDKGISTPSDLAGKRIGVTRKTSGEFYLGRFLTFNGLKLEDVQVEDLPPSGMIEGLESGLLDAVVTFEPNAYALKRKLGGGVISWSAQANQWTTALAYSTAPFVAANPDIVERYLRSLAQAEAYAAAYPDEAREIVAHSTGQDAAFMSYIWPKFDFTMDMKQDLLLAMEEETRWVIDNRLTDESRVPNYLENLYFAGLENVKPDSVTVVH